MKKLFDQVSYESTTLITKSYSTSFSIAVRLLAPSIRQAIYNIYGFVRIADEIVDSFEGYPQEQLLNRFEEDYAWAKKHKISSNPVINAFIQTVEKYNIDEAHVQAFLKSMRADLTKQVYHTQDEMNDYIYGSADVVGLMCLKVFVKGDQEKFNNLKYSAMKLGTAFQKVNFLRDLNQDCNDLNRTYFPGTDTENLTAQSKNKIVAEIKQDFKEAFIGVKGLPKEAKLGVLIAYKYYLKLLRKIEKAPAKELAATRIRVSNPLKIYVLCRSYLGYQLKYA